MAPYGNLTFGDTCRVHTDCSGLAIICWNRECACPWYSAMAGDDCEAMTEASRLAMGFRILIGIEYGGTLCYCLSVAYVHALTTACKKGPNLSLLGILLSTIIQVSVQVVQLADILGARMDKQIIANGIPIAESIASCAGMLALLDMAVLWIGVCKSAESGSRSDSSRSPFRQVQRMAVGFSVFFFVACVAAIFIQRFVSRTAYFFFFYLIVALAACLLLICFQWGAWRLGRLRMAAALGEGSQTECGLQATAEPSMNPRVLGWALRTVEKGSVRGFRLLYREEAATGCGAAGGGEEGRFGRRAVSDVIFGRKAVSDGRFTRRAVSGGGQIQSGTVASESSQSPSRNLTRSMRAIEEAFTRISQTTRGVSVGILCCIVALPCGLAADSLGLLTFYLICAIGLFHTGMHTCVYTYINMRACTFYWVRLLASFSHSTQTHTMLHGMQCSHASAPPPPPVSGRRGDDCSRVCLPLHPPHPRQHPKCKENGSLPGDRTQARLVFCATRLKLTKLVEHVLARAGPHPRS